MKKITRIGASGLILSCLLVKSAGRPTQLLGFETTEEWRVTATMYHPVENQCDGDPLITAGLYRINPKKATAHRWIAVSRNLHRRWGGKLRWGDLVRITGAGHKDGVYRVVDTMHPKFKNRIDFLETPGTKQYRYNDVSLSAIKPSQILFFTQK